MLDRSPFNELHSVCEHERLKDIDVNAMPDMLESAVSNALLDSVADNLDINVEVQIEVGGAALHTPHAAVYIEGWTPTLAPKPWR